MEVETQASGKKRRLDDVEADETAFEEAYKLALDPPSVNDPMPYTCICFEGKFYTTDSDGYFIHNVPDKLGKVPLYRCEVNPQMDVVFSYIRNLNETEMQFLETTDDVNVIRDLTKHNKSLFY